MFVCFYFEYGVLKKISNETLEIIQNEINTYSYPFNGLRKESNYIISINRLCNFKIHAGGNHRSKIFFV